MILGHLSWSSLGWHNDKQCSKRAPGALHPQWAQPRGAAEGSSQDRCLKALTLAPWHLLLQFTLGNELLLLHHCTGSWRYSRSPRCLSGKDRETVLLMQVPQRLKLGGINMPLIFQDREMLIALSYTQGHWDVWLSKDSAEKCQALWKIERYPSQGGCLQWVNAFWGIGSPAAKRR